MASTVNDLEGLLKHQLTLVRESQKKHYDPGKSDRKEEEKRIDTRYLYIPKLTLWTSKADEVMSCIPMKGGYVYHVNPRPDCLLHTRIEFTLPTLRVLDKYKGRVKIAWTRMPGLAVFQSGKMISDSSKIAPITRASLEFWYRVLAAKDPTRKAVLEEMIGDVPYLTEFSSILPETPISVPQPWFYASSECMAIPLFRCQKSALAHSYVYQLDPRELVRMAIQDRNGIWHYGSLDPQYLVGADEGIAKIATPDMIGTYTMMIDDERDFYNNLFTDTHGKGTESINHSCIQKIDIIHTISRTVEEGAILRIPLNTSDTCHHIGISFENIASTKRNDYFNSMMEIPPPLMEYLEGACTETPIFPGTAVVSYDKVADYPREQGIDPHTYSRNTMFRGGAGLGDSHMLFSFGFDLFTLNHDIGYCMDSSMNAFVEVTMENQDSIRKRFGFTRTEKRNDKELLGDLDDDPEVIESPEDSTIEEVSAVRNREKEWTVNIMLMCSAELCFDDDKCRVHH